MYATTIHLYMEVFGGLCLLFIGWLNISQKISGDYSKLIAPGCIIAGVAEIIHGTIPYIYPSVLGLEWMAISGGMGRLVLAVTLGVAIVCYDRLECCIKYIILGMSIPVMFSVLPLLIPTDLSWTYTHIWFFGLTIVRPIDFTLLIIWISLTIALRNKYRVIFPPNTYWIFMALGIMVHALMAFSIRYDFNSILLMSHALKLSEYYSFILIYCLYKISYDRTFQGNSTNMTGSQINKIGHSK